MSHTAFNARLVRFPASQDVGFGVVLLCVCLTARRPPTDALLSQREVHLAAKLVVNQVQICTGPSHDLIAASILLAVYEYACQTPDAAFTTLSVAIRMAYSVGLEQGSLSSQPGSDDPEQLLGSSKKQERNNLWWMLVICERYWGTPVPKA